MAAQILNGTHVRDELGAKLADEIRAFSPSPHLVIIQVGNLPESTIYIEQKKKFGEKIGCKVTHRIFPLETTTETLTAEIKKLNFASHVHGIIVQLPLPASIDTKTVMETIDPRKDVDGLTSLNLKLLEENKLGGVIPATARGVLGLLNYYGITVQSKRVVVVGRSQSVGRPIALVLKNNGALVTVCHRKTEDLKHETLQGDIIIAAAGSPRLITSEFVKENQVVIDVGINRITLDGSEKQKLIGDVDSAVAEKVAAISPVPGGIGPMTVLSLFQNLLDAYRIQTGR